MMPNERAQMVRAASGIEWRGNKGHRLEKVRDGHKLIIDQEPGYIYNKQDEIVGVDAWVKLYGPDGNEVKIDPHRRIINPPTVPRANVTLSEDGNSREVTQNPVSAFYEAVWDSVLGTPNKKGWRTRGTVTTVYADTSDGRIESSSPVYFDAADGNDVINVSTTGTTTAIGMFFSSTYSIYQQFWRFDTSPISDTDVVTDIDLMLWLVNDQTVSQNPILEVLDYLWSPTLSAGQFIPFLDLSEGTYNMVATLATNGIGSVGYKTFISESAFLSVQGLKTGTVCLAGTCDMHRLDIQPTGDAWVQFSHTETSGTTQDPKIVITHNAPPAANAPGLFTGRPNRIWRRR